MPTYASRSLWTSGAAFDPATTAWVAAVVAAGGTVSDARKTLVDNFVIGAKSDSFWPKLDRLWFFATGASTAGDQTAALIDVVADQVATAVNTPSFGNNGFTGDGTTSYLSSNFNPSTAPTPQWTLNSAAYGFWIIDSRTTGTASMFGSRAGPPFSDVLMLSGGADLYGVNSGTQVTGNYTDAQGNWCFSRTDANTVAAYNNGTSSEGDKVNAAAAGVNTQDLLILNSSAGSALPSSDQIAACWFGAGFSATDAANMHNRLRTYMTAVGVP